MPDLRQAGDAALAPVLLAALCADRSSVPLQKFLFTLSLDGEGPAAAALD
jgi:hypothetical protein